jgi:hypothetical protein
MTTIQTRVHEIWNKEQAKFAETYPGCSCDVLNANGNAAHGNTKLSAVRATY